MLTKDLVQATVRSGKLFPKFIKPGDAKAIADAETLCELFSGAKGRVVGDLDEEVKATSTSPRCRAFAKILFDHCEVSEPDDEIMDLRWRIYYAAEEIRCSGASSLVDFRRQLGEKIDHTPEILSQKIFSDLPNSRTVSAAPLVSPKDLIERYNMAHITTFLCLADDVTVSVSKVTLSQKRELMRRLKFHRLMSDVEIDKDSQTVTLQLSGPLKLFGKAQGYALRIANFFPFVAAMPEWSLEARVSWKGKKVMMTLDHDCGVSVRSSRSQGSYVPPEFQDVIASMKSSDNLEISPGEDFIHLGSQSYCFPDLVFKSGGKSKGIELFHPWHKGQARHRIETASRANSDCLLVGIERSLLKDPELKILCEKNSWFAKYGFEFSQFPTPTILRRAITRHD